MPESDKEYDLGQDLNMQVGHAQTSGAVTKYIHTSVEELDEKMSILNCDQRLFVEHVLRLAERDEESNQLFLTGGPGVGKSSVLKVIDLGLEEIYGRNEGQWKCHHVKVAFTDAACNVLGRGTGTIHSTFAVPINQNEIKCQHHVN